MASPQKEHGYTAIANELLEAFLRFSMPDESRRVFLAVLRKTYGFQKKSDRIPLSQIASMTYISRSHVSRAFRKLKAMKMISRDKSGVTSIVKDYSSWVVLPNQVVPHQVVPNGDQGAAPSGTRGAAPSGTLKRKVLKKGIKRNIPKGMERDAPTLSAPSKESSQPTEPMNQDIDRSFPRSRLYGNEAINSVLDFWEHKMPNTFTEDEKWARIYVTHLKNKIGLGKVRDIIEWASDPDCWWYSRLSGFKMLYYKRDQILRSMSEPRKVKGGLNLDEIK